MALKNITSSDPRKAPIVAAIKAASGRRMVTTVKHDTTRNVYQGRAVNKGTSDPNIVVRLDAETLEVISFSGGGFEYTTMVEAVAAAEQEQHSWLERLT